MSTELTRTLKSTLEASPKSLLLLGPRQCGKSTLMKGLSPHLEINLADEEVYLSFLRDPARLKNLIGNHHTIFIDEVQRLPSLLNTIQALIDGNKKLRFYLTGSSARKLRRGQANLLPGRLFTYFLGPLTCLELKSKFILERALSLGLLPEAYLSEQSNHSQKLLRSYASTYIKEEIQAEALTRNLEGFSRFLEVVASRSGDFIDFTKFASHSQIERSSAKRYFDILVDTLLVIPVEPFAKTQRRRLTQHPRYYFFDVGVLNGLLGNFEVSLDRKGALLENLVAQLLVSTAHALDKDYRLSVYRTEAGAEVDFIFEINKKVFAIEVKNTQHISSSDLRGFKSFKEFYRKDYTPILIYTGQENLGVDGIKVLPLTEALELIFS